MQFAVTASDLTKAATNCTTTNTQVQADIAKMISFVGNLMGSYQGNAALAMESVTQQWSNDATQLNYVLTTISQGLNSNANNYTDNEQINTANYSNIAGNLPAAVF